MATNTENPTAPTLLVLEKGAENLAGRRRLAGDVDEAAEVAADIDGQIFALEPVEPNPELMPPLRVVPAASNVHPLTGKPWDQSAPAVFSAQAASFIRRQTYTDMGGDAA